MLPYERFDLYRASVFAIYKAQGRTTFRVAGAAGLHRRHLNIKSVFSTEFQASQNLFFQQMLLWGGFCFTPDDAMFVSVSAKVALNPFLNPITRD